MDWQRIETARKVENRPILGFCPADPKNKYAVDEFVVVEWCDFTKSWQDRVEGLSHSPSHWMEIPAPPSEQG